MFHATAVMDVFDNRSILLHYARTYLPNHFGGWEAGPSLRVAPAFFWPFKNLMGRVLGKLRVAVATKTGEDSHFALPSTGSGGAFGTQ